MLESTLSDFVAATPPPSTARRSDAWVLLDQVTADQPNWEPLLAGMGAVWVDAVLTADSASLEALVDPLRDQIAELEGHGEIAGWLKNWMTLTAAALARMPAKEELALRENGYAMRFLEALAASQTSLNGIQLRHELDTSESQVSRVGRELLARGLVVQRRAGRVALWELTARGQHLLKRLRKDLQEVRHVEHTRRVHAADRRRRSGTEGTRRRTPAKARVLYRDGAAKRANGHVERYVHPNAAGGWHIAASPHGRAIRKFGSKQEAIERAKVIVANAGGGQVVAEKQGGVMGQPIRVPPRRSA